MSCANTAEPIEMPLGGEAYSSGSKEPCIGWSARSSTGDGATFDAVHILTHALYPPVRDDNGSAGHGSSGSTTLSGSRRSRVSTRDPLTHDQVNKIPRTG